MDSVFSTYEEGREARDPPSAWFFLLAVDRSTGVVPTILPRAGTTVSADPNRMKDAFVCPRSQIKPGTNFVL